MLSSADRPAVSTMKSDVGPFPTSPVNPTPPSKTGDDHHDALLAKLDSLRREDETLNNILAVDVWALAKTMDEFQPGFWSEFMKTRERALRRFMNEVVVKSKPTNLRRHPFLG
jgi:hypothetical protein